MLEFNCKCGNNEKQKTFYYYNDGVNYEAIICMCCGRYYDHDGKHEKDEWSEDFMLIVTNEKMKINVLN